MNTGSRIPCRSENAIINTLHMNDIETLQTEGMMADADTVTFSGGSTSLIMDWYQNSGMKRTVSMLQGTFRAFGQSWDFSPNGIFLFDLTFFLSPSFSELYLPRSLGADTHHVTESEFAVAVDDCQQKFVAHHHLMPSFNVA